MKKQKKSPSALDMLDQLGLDNVENGSTVTNLDGDGELVDVSTDVDEIDEIENKQVEETQDTAEETEDDVPQEILDKMNKQTSSEETLESETEEEQTEEITDAETQGVGMFFDAFAEALNWDVEDDEKPQSIDDLIDYIQDVVDQNSTPEYADDRIAQLDQYVKNGGKFEDFYSNMSERISYDNLDMEDEAN